MHDVRNVLSHYPFDCQPAQIEPLGSAGGMSGAQFWRITVRDVRGSPAQVVRGSPDPARRTLCLRRWPTEHPSRERLQFIHAVLSHAERNGITCLPVPITTKDGQSFVDHAGHLWELAPWLPGTADYDHSPSRAKLGTAMSALANFHRATIDFPIATSQWLAGQPPPIAKRLAKLQQLTHSAANELAHSITDTTWPDLAPLARQFIAALSNAVPRAIAQLEPLASIPLPLQVCLRDIWHDHVLFTGDEVTGIVDFGAVDVDTPATDIARLLGSLVPTSPPRRAEGPGEGHLEAEHWQTGLAAYSAIRPLSEEEMRAVKALDSSGTILAGCNWLRWIYIEGRDFENRAAIVQRFCRIMARVAP